MIDAEKPLEQLSEVVAAFELARPTRLFTRCRVCNAVVRQVERPAVADRVPPRVWERESEFTECPHCGRVYWEGSHAQRADPQISPPIASGPASTHPPRAVSSASRARLQLASC